MTPGEGSQVFDAADVTVSVAEAPHGTIVDVEERELGGPGRFKVRVKLANGYYAIINVQHGQMAIEAQTGKLSK